MDIVNCAATLSEEETWAWEAFVSFDFAGKKLMWRSCKPAFWRLKWKCNENELWCDVGEVEHLLNVDEMNEIFLGCLVVKNEIFIGCEILPAS